MQWSRCVAGAVAMSVISTGCRELKQPSRASSDSSAAPVGAAAPFASHLRNYTIDATDYAYAHLPLHAPAGWLTLRLVNIGTEQHMLSVVPVPSGYTIAMLTDSLVHLHMPANAKSSPGVDVVSPGDTAAVTAYFPPGDYVVGCFVKSPDGTYHVVKGMAGSFDVVAYSDTGSAPHADAVVALSHKRVALTGNVKAGTRTIRIATDDAHWQDFQVLRLQPGRTAAQAINWYNNRATVAPAADAFGGVSSLQSGQRSFMTADFAPGAYLLLFPTGGSDARPTFAQYVLTVAP